MGLKRTGFDPVEVEKLSKGLHEFHISPGQRAPRLPDDYLQDYLDAFIEEAYEHEYGEATHRAPRLEGGDPYMHLARCIYNELLVFAVHNPNLLRAIKKFGIKKPLYILERLNHLGLCRVNTANYEAEHQARIGGYYEERVEPLATQSPMGATTKSMDAAFAAAQKDEYDFKKAGAKALAPGPEMVTLVDDTVDPFAALKKSHDSRPDAFGRKFVLDQGQVVATTDADCPIHGMKDLTKSMNLNNLFVQCTCGHDEG